MDMIIQVGAILFLDEDEQWWLCDLLRLFAILFVLANLCMNLVGILE